MLLLHLKVVDDGFTAEELEQAVEGYISDRNRQWAANSTIASLLVKATKIDQDLSFYDEQIVALKKLTLEQVHDAFVKYIAAQQLNVFKAGDFAKVADQT